MMNSEGNLKHNNFYRKHWERNDSVNGQRAEPDCVRFMFFETQLRIYFDYKENSLIDVKLITFQFSSIVFTLILNLFTVIHYYWRQYNML